MKLRLLHSTPDEPNHVPVKGLELRLQRALAWGLYGPPRRLVDSKFRKEWDEGKHRIGGKVPWKAEW
jgi:hypothetical protein